MWILPKQLHTSAYAQDTKALGLDSEKFCQICERSLTWRGKDSLSRTWLQRWKRESWMQHLSSRTLRPSLTESFVDKWTSSLEDSRANHSALLESVKLLKTPDTSSPTSQTESESANLELFSLKTYKASSPAKQETENPFSNMSSESWKEWVTEQRQEYSQRKKSAHLIRESESSSWPTATVFDTTGGSYPTEIVDGVYRSKHSQEPNSPWYGAKLKDAVETHEKNWATPQVTDVRTDVRKPSERSEKAKKGGCKNLREEVMQPQNWPTATTRDWKDTNATVPPSRATPSKQTLGQRVAYIGLQDQAKLNTNGKSQESQQWPTPRANKVHPEITEENREHLANRNKANLEEDIAGHCGKATGKLNPNWVEHLMGLPVGWTQLPIEWIDSGYSATAL